MGVMHPIHLVSLPIHPVCIVNQPFYCAEVKPSLRLHAVTAHQRAALGFLCHGLILLASSNAGLVAASLSGKLQLLAVYSTSKELLAVQKFTNAPNQ